MSNDLTFLNTYTEVVQENVSAIIKQNFVFQTQLKMAENKLAVMDDAIRNADNLSVQNKELQTKINELLSLTSSYKTVADDKSRLQSSLNETSQVKNQMQTQLNDMQQELTRLRLKTDDYEAMKKENNVLRKKLGLDAEKTPAKKTEKPAVVKESPAGTF
jgi:chromosome segregation ATPase